jgi:hypothetical protein
MAARDHREYRVKVGDLIEVKDKSKQLALVLKRPPRRTRCLITSRFHSPKMTAKVTRILQITEVLLPREMEPHLVVEFIRADVRLHLRGIGRLGRPLAFDGQRLDLVIRCRRATRRYAARHRGDRRALPAIVKFESRSV